ncbi:phage tail tape measure protein [Clostridium paraputrificum]|uniref:phage tail tape measure protein n=1 Tax=Clostridium paraputrificum TaxID=29363 RepID=UPI00374EFE43
MSNDTKRVNVVYGLKSDEFTKNLTEMKKQIQLTGSELQLAGQKVNTYGANLVNLGEKQNALNTQIKNVTNQMKLYDDSIAKNTTKLNENKAKLDEIKKQKSEINKQYKDAVKAYGEESEQAITLKAKLNELNEEYKEADNKIKNNIKSINNHTKEANKAEAELTKLRGELNNVNEAIAKNSNGFLNASKEFEKAGNKLKSFGGSISDVGGKLMMISAPMVALSGYAVKAQIDFESAFTGVRKTVDGTEKQFAELRESILEMSKAMPESASSIAGVAEAAGQLGIEVDNIDGFTKAMVMLGDSTNMSSEQASTSLARLANITGMSQKDFDRLGSVIVALGNNLATTESEITEMGLRLAGAGSQVGLTEAQILSFAGALSSVGIEAEAGGSAFSKVLIQMQLAVEKGGKSLNNFAKVAGMSSKEFQKSFKQDATGAIIAFIKGLSDCESKGISAIKVLDDMGIKEVRLRDTLLRASGASDIFTKSIALGNTAWSENTALTKEAETRYATTASKIEMLKNRFFDLGLELGEELMPYITELMDGLENLIDWFGNLDSDTQKAILNFGLMTFATGGLLKAVGGVSKGIGSLSSGIGGLLRFIGKYTTATTASATATTAMATASTSASVGVTGLGAKLGIMSGIALPVIGVLGGLAGALYTAHEYTDLYSQSILKSTDEMSGMEIFLGRLTGATMYSKEEMEQLGLKYKEWNNDISPETQKELETISEKIRDLGLTIQEVNIDDMISEEDRNTVVSDVDRLCQDIVAKIREHETEANKAISDMFNTDGAIDEQEKKMLEIINKSNEEQIKAVKDKTNKIKEIISKSYKEQRGLTEQEESEINRLKQEISDLALQTTVNSQEELLKAKAEFNARAMNLDAEGAKAYMQEKIKQRDEEIALIREKYDTAIEELKLHSDRLTGEEKAQAEALIKSKEAERDAELKIVNDKYMESRKLLEEHYSDISKTINKYTGEELTRADIRKQESLDKMKEQYDGLNSITESGLYSLYDKNKKTYRDIAVLVDENTKEVIGAYDTQSAKVGGYTKEIANSVESMGVEHVRAKNIILGALTQMGGATVNAKGEMVNAYGNVVASLDELTEHTDGTRAGILDLNGTPIKIQTNKDGVISNIDEIKKSLENIPRKISVTVGMQTDVRVAGGNGLRVQAYANGASNAVGGIAKVNENGWELFDNISSVTRALNNEMAYVPPHTQVKTHLASTLEMKREIAKEVARVTKDNDAKSINPIFNVKTDVIVKGNMDQVSSKKLKDELNKRDKELTYKIFKELKQEIEKY